MNCKLYICCSSVGLLLRFDEMGKVLNYPEIKFPLTRLVPLLCKHMNEHAPGDEVIIRTQSAQVLEWVELMRNQKKFEKVDIVIISSSGLTQEASFEDAYKYCMYPFVDIDNLNKEKV